MSPFWIITWFFVKHFLIGFASGCFLRLMIALVFKGDVTLTGVVRLGGIIGVIYLLLTCRVAGIF